MKAHVKKQLSDLAPEIIELVKTVSTNSKVSSKDFLQTGDSLRTRLIAFYEQYAARDQNGIPLDQHLRAIEDAINSKEGDLRSAINDLVYNGVINPIEYLKVLTDTMGDDHPVTSDILRGTLSNPAFAPGGPMADKGCAACIACISCAGCIWGPVVATATTASTLSLAG